MASGGKKFGGVKKSGRRGASPAVHSSDPAPSRSFGGVVPQPPGTSSGHMESCPDNCPGEYINGMWIHSRECVWASVLWKAHGKTLKDWHCPYDCDPCEMPSGWTHFYACPFWNRTGRTPIDHLPPKDVNRGETQGDRDRRVAAERFKDFPHALTESGDDLPL